MEPLSSNEAIILRPIQIRIGPENANLSITDGPAALGYIFSIAKPTLDSPTIPNYYLPLLAIYARVIYMTYICTTGPEPDVGNIPVMCCIMYVAPKSNPAEQPRFFLSSSWSGKNCSAEKRLRQAVDTWRKEVLATCLRQTAPGTGEGMPKALPAFEPLYLKELCRLLWKNLRGKGKESESNPIIQTTILAKLHGKSTVQHLARYSEESRLTLIAIREYLASQSKVEPILMSLLADAIKAKFNAGPINTYTPVVVQTLIALFQFYCTSQFQFPGGEIVKLVDPPDDWQKLWDQHHPQLKQLLQDFFTAQRAQQIPPG